jgi:hypothetical protein
LGDDLPTGAGKVQGQGGHVAAEVADVENEAFRPRPGVAPQGPAGAEQGYAVRFWAALPSKSSPLRSIWFGTPGRGEIGHGPLGQGVLAQRRRKDIVRRVDGRGAGLVQGHRTNLSYRLFPPF